MPSFHAETAKLTPMELFEEVEGLFPEHLRRECWYLAAASSLVATSKSSVIGDLYTYLLEKDARVAASSGAEQQFRTSEQRKRLSRRLRECLMKEFTLVGIPLVLGAISALAAVEKAEDADATFTRSQVNLKDVSARGTAHLDSLYKENLQPIFDTWGAHTHEVQWLEKDIIYGVFLSDFSVLDPVETQMVVLPAIMCQGVRGATGWHLRATRRLGVSVESVGAVQRAVEVVARWAGRDVEGLIRVEEIEGEV